MRILLLALAMLLLPTSAVGLESAPGELAFVAAAGRVPQIFVVGADGTRRRQLTGAAGPSTTPVWSPDGQRIAFVRQTGSETNIYVMNADGGSQHPLTTGPGHVASPAWSPDSRQIVFAETGDDASQIVGIRSDGSRRRDLAPSRKDQRTPAWSPDGQLIAFLSKESGGYFALYVVGADGRNLRRVPTPVPSFQPDVTEFTWLPDGRLAYTSRSGLSQEGLSVTTVSGAEHQYLGSGSSPAWSRDGRQFAFVVSHSGTSQVYVRSAGGKARQLVDPSLTAVRPAWSPDGRQIAILLLGAGTTTLAVVDPDGGHLRRLADDLYGDLSARPVFSWRPR